MFLLRSNHSWEAVLSKTKATPTGRESPFSENEIIVTKTDTKGRLTYANEVFLRLSRVSLTHGLIRHPEMPRCVFRLLWETLEAKGEFFGYVKNMALNGDHYWVFAHATPSFGANGEVVGYHSNRRKPDPAQIARIEPVYKRLLEEERRHGDRKQGMYAGTDLLNTMLREKGLSYERFAFSL